MNALRIAAAHMSEFATREHEFQIPAAWISRENNQFIWVLGYDGPEAWADKQSAYYGSSQRQSLTVDPLDLIAHGDTWNISAVTSDD